MNGSCLVICIWVRVVMNSGSLVLCEMLQSAAIIKPLSPYFYETTNTDYRENKDKRELTWSADYSTRAPDVSQRPPTPTADRLT